MGMRAQFVIPVLVSILILGTLGLSQNAFSAIFIDAFDVSGQDDLAVGLAFNTDGTKMFVMGIQGLDVNEYACGTGFDVSTCAFTVKAGNPFSIAAQEIIPRSLEFNTDGTKMFVMGIGSDAVNEYACGTGFDVSTCAYSGDAERFDVLGEELLSRSLAFNTDGTKMFVMGAIGLDVNEYACGTGFDVSTCAFTVKAGNPFSIAAQESGPLSLAFNTDGTKMFVMGQASNAVNEYACGTGFDVSTCAYSGDAERFDISGQEISSQSLAFNTDGTKMFVMGAESRAVNEYSLPIAFDVSSVGTIITDDFNDNLIVEPGDTVIVDGATVSGNVSVDGGTLILSQSSTVTGNLEGINGASIIIQGGSTVDGNIEIIVSGSESTLEITDSNVGGNIQTNNIDALTIINSILNGNIHSDNDGTVTITNNININGNLEIISPASCTESNNTVNGNNSGCPP